jgi:hypothetical protein
MVEIQILVTPGGISRTQLFGRPDEHEEGVRLFQKILPIIRHINNELQGASHESTEDTHVPGLS